MKHLRIFPAAAGIIALTATIGFAQDTRENEGAGFLRVKIGTIEITRKAYDIYKNLLPAETGNETRHAYIVEIEHGNKSKEVTIDAYTGKILTSRNIPV